MTIRVSPEIKSKLERITIDTRRSTSFLAAEAVSAYVEHELQSLDGIKRGMADARLGHVVPHDDAMAEIHAVIDAAEAARASKREAAMTTSAECTVGGEALRNI